MSCENGVNTGLDCKTVGMWRACDMCKHYTKILIALNISRYRNYIT